MRTLNLRSPSPVSTVYIVLAIALCAPQLLFAQYAINTIAGGGPNNLPAAKSSLGYPVGVALDSAGNVYIAESYLSSQILEVSTTGTVTVVAGNGTSGYSGDGGPATSAALNQPEGVFIDKSGNIFIADTNNCAIREVSGGNISTVAGSPALQQPCGYGGDGGPPTSAQLDDPVGVFVDGSGNIYIADTDNSVIRVVNTGSSSITIGAVTIQPGTIRTIAGTPDTVCAVYPCGDGGPPTSAQLYEPFGVSLDSQGNIFIADTFNSVIRVVNPSAAPVTIANTTIPAGDIQAVAGTYYSSSEGAVCTFTGDNGPAFSAYLCQPGAVAVDSSENIFIADTANFGIREVVSAGTISTVAGTLGTACASYSPPGTACGNGNPATATGAFLNYPSGVTVDTSDDIFIADTDDFAIREVTGGNIQPLAGNDTLTYSGDGGAATNAQLGFPGGTFVNASGNVYIADTYNSVIRVLNPGSSPVTINNVTIAPGDIETVAGNGISCAVPAPGGCGDGGLATSAQLNFPEGVFVDGSGNIYIADTGLPLAEDSAVRVVNTSSSPATIAGVTIPAYSIATVAGTLGSAGFSGDGGAATSAELDNPQGVLVDGLGNIYIADTGNSAIRVVNTGTSALTIGTVTIPPGDIETVAGTPPTACTDTSSGCGDGGPARSAYLNFPNGIALDATENIYIADTDDEVIRVINPGTQPVTIAGTTIQGGNILTVAGNLGQRGYSGDGEPPTATTPSPVLLDSPWDVFVDTSNNIFIADSDNGAIREVVAAATVIQTIAGNGTLGFSGDGGSATIATLDAPQSVFLDGSGNVFIADTENSRIRQLVSTVTLAVAPPSATVPVSGSQQFLATVNGASNTSVTWQVNGIAGGNSMVGTIASDGLYQAPATQPTPSTITVTAIYDADNNIKASAQVTIVGSGAASVVVSTSPSGVAVVYTSTTQTFIATVTGESTTSVNWEVNGVAGGNSTVGTISTAGLYTAPSAVPSPAAITITAVSAVDSTTSGSYPITIVIAPSASQPAPQTVSPGQTANYSLSLNAKTGVPNQPITLSCLQSSLPSGASCVFSQNGKTVTTVTPGASAVPFSLAVSVPSHSASLLKVNRPGFAPQLYVGFIPLAGILLLGGKRNRRWLWLALLGICLLGLVACGGGSTSTTTTPVSYTIQIQGTTAAQPNPVTITTAGLTVQ
jgi:sugar lactone lactonase YvrE